MPGYAKIEVEGHRCIIITSREVGDALRAGGSTVIDVTDRMAADTHDWVTNRSRAALNQIADEIHHAFLLSPVVIIHCDHGRSRSPIAAGAYLIRYHQMGREGAIAAVTRAFDESHRPHGDLNTGRLEHQLLCYDIGMQ